MPEFYVINNWEHRRYGSEAEAIEGARKEGASGTVVQAVAAVEWVNPAPIFHIKSLRD